MTVRLLLCLAAPMLLVAGESELRRAFQGRQVYVKIDMPGTHNGVDLHLDRDEPMDWRQYSQRLKNFGVSISKGRPATVTGIVVKKDLIEFQLDGGGYGTFGDDTSTSVSTYVPKSRYESDLERDIRRETDPNRKRRLEADLSRERSRRYAEERRLRAAAETANAIKRQEIMERRLRGGSRFNLRGIPGAFDVLPNQVADWLREYVDFDGNVRQPESRPPAQTSSAPRPAEGGTLRRGMALEEVQTRLGRGKLLSESVGTDNILTQQWEFVTPEANYNVTVVEGLVIKYAMTSR
jgi:hypothetical protein